jgi:hypothetical protein
MLQKYQKDFDEALAELNNCLNRAGWEFSQHMVIIDHFF